MASQRARAVSRAGPGKLQDPAAVRGHDAQIKVHQHGRLRPVRIMAGGAGGALAAHVQAVPAETAVGQHAVLHVMTFIAQGVVGERVGNSAAAAGRDRGRFQDAGALQQMRQVRAVRPAGCGAGSSQVPSGVAVVAVSAIDKAAAGKWPGGDRRAAAVHHRGAQAGHFRQGEIAGAGYRMEGIAEREFSPGVVRGEIAGVKLPLRISSIADSGRALVERLRLVCAVTVALEADFELIGSLGQKGVAGGLSLHSEQRAADEWRLRRSRRGHVRIVAIFALRVARQAHAGFRQRMRRRTGTFRGIVDRRRQQHRVFIGLAKKIGLDVARGDRAVMALEADIFFQIFHQPLRHLWRVRTMAALTTVVPDSRVAGMRALRLRITHIGGRVGRDIVGRIVPARLLMASQTERRGLIGFDQEFAGGRIGVFTVRIMAADALQLAAFVEAHRVGHWRVLYLGPSARNKTKRMVVGEGLVAGQVRSRIGGQSVAVALRKCNAAIIHRIAQRDGAVMAAQAELGGVLRLDGGNNRLQRAARINGKIAGGELVVPEIAGAAAIVRRVAKDASVAGRNRFDVGRGRGAKIMLAVDNVSLAARLRRHNAAHRKNKEQQRYGASMH